MRKKIYLLTLFLFSMHQLFSQCAMCKAVAEEVAEENGSTINTGIMYIMTVPYILLIVGIIGALGGIYAFRKNISDFLKDLKSAGIPSEQ